MIIQLPLYFGLASAGIIFIISRLTEIRIGRHQPILIAGLALIVSVWVGSNVLRTQAVYYSNEGGAYRDAEQITIFLKDYLEANDAVVSDLNLPLFYYFTRHGVPVTHLHTEHPNLNTSPRVVVVFNYSQSPTTVEQILQRAQLATDLYTPPELIRQFDSTEVYEMRLKLCDLLTYQQTSPLPPSKHLGHSCNHQY